MNRPFQVKRAPDPSMKTVLIAVALLTISMILIVLAPVLIKIYFALLQVVVR